MGFTLTLIITGATGSVWEKVVVAAMLSRINMRNIFFKKPYVGLRWQNTKYPPESVMIDEITC
jgi:hypothetical protein